MTRALPSYVLDNWQTPTDTGRLVHSAVDGAPVAVVSSTGVDFGAVLEHARCVGGPALRDLSFHERAGMLKELVTALGDAKAELYELSTLTGATRSDAWFDVDGGIGTLATYASKGRRELPDGNVIIEPPPEPLSRDGTFLGLHVLTARRGAAVFINAFNFPVWGMLEKFAPAFLAGVPSIIKPATPTAFVAEAAVRAIIDADILPAGALQFIAGSVGDLLERLDGQDYVGFTGSASTAAHLRGLEAIRRSSVRFVAETDSLNSAVLAPSAGADSPEVELFIDEVVKELTAKAGQRCTAIRRAFVPASMLDEVVGRLRTRVESLRVGDPSDPSTDIGPLVSNEQVAEVGRALEALTEGCQLVVDPADLDRTSLHPDGAYHGPVVLLARDPTFSPVHEVEPFGPVTTVIPYQDIADAVDLVARGGGSLVASVFAEDPATVTELVAGLAPHHGRVLVVDSTCAATQTGHGSPMPHLVHGGPGRAGGGEELGGVRAVRHHMQRTALQGSPDALTAAAGQYLPGAARRTSTEHPFQRSFEDLQIGDAVVTPTRTISLEDIEAFAGLSGDTFYVHMDQSAAERSPVFDGRAAHGYFILAAAAGLFVWPDPGPVLANVGIDSLRFARPVYPGDTIRVALTCKRKKPHGSKSYGEVAWDADVTNQHGETVASYDVVTLVATRNAAQAQDAA